jgi:hypothetical protein
MMVRVKVGAMSAKPGGTAGSDSLILSQQRNLQGRDFLFPVPKERKSSP